MNLAQRLSIPVLAFGCVAIPLYWAFPDALSGWRFAGIVLGWIGSGLLLACLMLMLREPMLARWLGSLERMYRWHHAVGVLAYVVLLAHPLLLAATVWHESPGVAWSLLVPDAAAWSIWSGWLALLLLMAGLAASFAARLDYRIWRWLHGLLGVGVLVAAGHLMLLGLSGIVLALTVAILVLLAWRVARADIGFGAAPHVVVAVRHVADASVEIALQPLASPIRAVPGQFVLAAFFPGNGYAGCREYHPFTVSAIEADGGLRIGVKALGDCTRQMQSLASGVPARVQGPFGDFLPLRQGALGTAELWIAGGIGITPFLARLRQAAEHPIAADTDLIYFHRDQHDAAFLDELQELAAATPRFSFIDHPTGPGLPDLAAALPDATRLTNREVFLCGPPGLITAAVGMLSARGLSPSAIHFERFDFR